MSLVLDNPETPGEADHELKQSNHESHQLAMPPRDSLQEQINHDKRFSISQLLDADLRALGYRSQWSEIGVAQLGKLLRNAGVELKKYRITMVDDTAALLASFAGPLQVSTAGKASFILHTDQTLQELAELVLETRPNIVLIDYALSGFAGTKLANALTTIEGDQRPIIFGFSGSDASAVRDEFQQRGAIATIKKDHRDVVSCIAKVSTALRASAAA